MRTSVARASLIGTALLLSVLGIIFVYSASTAESLDVYGSQYTIVRNHLFGVGLALIAGLIGHSIQPSWWLKVAKPLYVAGCIVLALVLVPGIGVAANGAQRWISLGGLRIQPVETFKFIFVVFQSSWLTQHQRLGPLLSTTSIPALLLLLQPDLGSLLVLGAIAAGLYYIAGASLKSFSQLAALGIGLILLLIIISPYRLRRLTSFMNPEADLQGANFQVHQMTLALGRGGLLGNGIGNSQQKYLYIPEASTDAIFAIIGEELGYLGALVILLLYGAFFVLGSQIARQQESPQLSLIAYGLIIWVGTQTILNLGAVSVLLPLTGIPLPFFSYGRTSQIMIWFATGVLARLSVKPS